MRAAALSALGLVAAVALSSETTASVAGLPAAVVDGDYYDDAYNKTGDVAREKFELGRMLFFDKVLSGNRNIACATSPMSGSSGYQKSRTPRKAT